jgi:quinolinate synthase
MKEENPEAELIAHPECNDAVLELADYIGSTTGMLKYTAKSSSEKFIVATETGIIHQMQLQSPEKEFLVVPTDETCACNDCPYMKLITMEKLYLALKNEEPEITMDKETIKLAKKPIERMLEISRKAGLI